MLNYKSYMVEKYGQRYQDYRSIYDCNELKQPLPFPIELDLDVIDACNLTCPACHSVHRTRSQKKMPIAFLKQIAEECGRFQLPAVNIGGCGEPLLAPELVIEALKLFQSIHVMDIFLHTNGHFLTEELSRKLIENGVTYLCVSIDATTPETYQKMRGASLASVIENIEKFLKVRGRSSLPALRVSFLATPINIHEKDDFLAYWKTKADIVDIQKYEKSKYSDIEELETEDTNMEPVFHSHKKRMAVVAPDYLCHDCGEENVVDAVKNQSTLSNFGSIQKYWQQMNQS